MYKYEFLLFFHLWRLELLNLTFFPSFVCCISLPYFVVMFLEPLQPVETLFKAFKYLYLFICVC